MDAIIERLKNGLQSDRELDPTLADRLDKLAEDLQAPVKIKAPIFH